MYVGNFLNEIQDDSQKTTGEDKLIRKMEVNCAKRLPTSQNKVAARCGDKQEAPIKRTSHVPRLI